MLACKQGVPYKTGGDFRFYGAEGVFNYYMTKEGFHTRFNQIGNVTSVEITNYEDAELKEGVWRIPKGVDIVLGFATQLFFMRYPNPDRFPYRQVEDMYIPSIPYEFHIFDGAFHMQQYQHVIDTNKQIRR